MAASLPSSEKHASDRDVSRNSYKLPNWDRSCMPTCSLGHNTPTPGQPVLALTPKCQVPGMVATRVTIFQSLLQFVPDLSSDLPCSSWIFDHLVIYRGFPTRMVYFCYISCLRYTILAGSPRYNRPNSHTHHKLKLAPLPTCLCGQENQTAKHVLQRCPLYKVTREDVWPVSTPLMTKLYDSKQELEKTTSFISRAALIM